jgi:hypothetical protein
MTKNDIDRIKDYLDLFAESSYRSRAIKLTFETISESSMLHISVQDDKNFHIYESCRYESPE